MIMIIMAITSGKCNIDHRNYFDLTMPVVTTTTTPPIIAETKDYLFIPIYIYVYLISLLLTLELLLLYEMRPHWVLAVLGIITAPFTLLLILSFDVYTRVKRRLHSTVEERGPLPCRYETIHL